ncbi:MAG: hypothetical protein RIS76_3694 [Verrucomicrobiota bacterium]
MALDAVLEVWDAFLDVFCPDSVGLMLVAAVAGVAAVVVADMARGAGNTMISVEDEESVVRERRWFPALGRVALGAVRGGSFMHPVVGRGVAGGAIPASSGFQERMRKGRLTDGRQSWCGMFAVAGQAILGRQRLMKGGFGDCLNGGLQREFARGGSEADRGHRVTVDAAFRDCPTKGRVAGGTVVREIRVCGPQGSGADHLLRVEDRKRHKPGETGGKHQPKPGAFHFHPPKK